jgi:threonine synthase
MSNENGAETGSSEGAARYVSARGDVFDTGTALWRAPDGSHLNLTPGSGLGISDIQTDDRSIWRYSKAIRTEASRRVSLGEGWTPLLAGEWSGAPVSWKLEYFAPTGSFKDRGSSVLMTYLKSVGIKAILEDSSGNAGASLAAYCAASGISCRVLAPARAPKGKIMTISALGADVVLVEGTRQDVADAALREAENIFYASHNWQPYFLEGTKTLAFELWEQSGFKAPEAVLVPLGYGSNVLGLWLGFNELLACGAVDRIPRIYAAQAANCAAFAAAWKRGVDAWTPFPVDPTVADGIASVHPVRLKEVLHAVRESGGAVVAVSEDEIAGALKGLLGRGLFVEPTCATAAAALTRLGDENVLPPGSRPVVVLTGSGLKAADKIGEIVGARGAAS